MDIEGNLVTCAIADGQGAMFLRFGITRSSPHGTSREFDETLTIIFRADILTPEVKFPLD